MVSSLLRVTGHGQDTAFSTYHRVLNRATWSSREASRLLLGLLLVAFAPEGPLVLGIDETLERRRGKTITAAGIYRDPMRSSHSHLVKVRALRWISLMLLVPIPWAGRTGALPFLSALAPSVHYDAAHGQRHKTMTDWARGMVYLVHRWQPTRPLVLVGEGAYAVLEFLDATRPVATIVTRLRLDARLFAPAPPRAPGQKGRPRLVGARLPSLAARLADPTTLWASLTVPFWYGETDRTLEAVSETVLWYSRGLPPVPLRWVLLRDPAGGFPPQALLCTDLTADPVQIVSWFVLRWQMESTFHEVRAHLGVETGRGWSEKTIRRTTPALWGLFSFVALVAHDLWAEGHPVAKVVGLSSHAGRRRWRAPEGRPLVGRAGPHDAQDGGGEQDRQGHIRADEGGGEGGGHDVEGRRGGVGQRGEEGDEGAGEGREREGGEAEHSDAGAGLHVGYTSPPAARLSPRGCRASLSCAMAPALLRSPCTEVFRRTQLPRTAKTAPARGTGQHLWSMGKRRNMRRYTRVCMTISWSAVH